MVLLLVLVNRSLHILHTYAIAGRETLFYFIALPVRTEKSAIVMIRYDNKMRPHQRHSVAMNDLGPMESNGRATDHCPWGKP